MEPRERSRSRKRNEALKGEFLPSALCALSTILHLSGPGKHQFSFQSPRKALPEYIPTTTQLHSSHASKVMLKVLQARLQQYVNCELLDGQAGFRKGRGTRNQIADILWITEKAREF